MSVDLSAQLLSADAALPSPLLDLAAALAPGARVVPLWRNDLGGITVRLEQPDDAHAAVLKWSPPGREVDLVDERARLDWAAPFHPVPRVIDLGEFAAPDSELTQWMLSEALPGETAVSDHWRARPATAVTAIARGLRRLHEAVPVDQCPFDGAELPEGAEPDHPVVSHGDACAPNTLLAADGDFLAHVDLGALGVADRWLDLAIASMSLEWNFGPGWEDQFFDDYGIDPDPTRIAAWRRWWNRPVQG